MRKSAQKCKLDNHLSKGDWWVLKGQNCGQDETVENGWYGGADWCPCQHGRFVKADDGSWINNTTFCAGTGSLWPQGKKATTGRIGHTKQPVVKCHHAQYFKHSMGSTL